MQINTRKGFTLAELMVSVGVISIMTFTVAINFRSSYNPIHITADQIVRLIKLTRLKAISSGTAYAFTQDLNKYIELGAPEGDYSNDYGQHYTGIYQYGYNCGALAGARYTSYATFQTVTRDKDLSYSLPRPINGDAGNQSLQPSADDLEFVCFDYRGYPYMGDMTNAATYTFGVREGGISMWDARKIWIRIYKGGAVKIVHRGIGIDCNHEDCM